MKIWTMMVLVLVGMGCRPGTVSEPESLRSMKAACSCTDAPWEEGKGQFRATVCPAACAGTYYCDFQVTEGTQASRPQV
jgi:hypothetical protein